MKKNLLALSFLNFFIADVSAGIGPFLGIFLLQSGWQSGLIGTVITIGGITGMIMTIPAGALIDYTIRKRTFIIIPCILTVVASFLILFSQQFWIVVSSQIATTMAGAILGPAVIAITLGIVRQKGFPRQNGLNQAFNHAGNVIGAALSGYLGLKFGIQAVFWLAALFGVFAICCTLVILPKDIDNDAARGAPTKQQQGEKTTAIQVLKQQKPLLILALALACFHLGNAGMLPLYGLAAATKKTGDPTVIVALTIIVAQVVMIFASIVAMYMAEKSGYWLILFISFLSLPIRCVVAAYMISDVGLYPVQILDGIGAGLQSVAIPGLVAQLLNGTGHINIGRGAVMTIQGIGAALSPVIGGWIAQQYSYSIAFLALGCFSIIALILWSFYAKKFQI